jgi:hypothetical protein
VGVAGTYMLHITGNNGCESNCSVGVPVISCPH